MTEFQIKYASYEDNKELLDILLEVPILSKTLGYYTDKRPNFFKFLDNLYKDYKVVTIRKDNKILGFVTVSFYDVYLDKKAQRISYLAELRLRKEFRKLKLAEKLLKEAVKISSNFNIFTCIATDNKIAKKKWQNLSQENFITLNKLTNVNTYFILPIKVSIKNKYLIRNASIFDINKMFEIWHLVMINKNLSQYFSFSEFKNIVNLIGISNFILCIDKNKVVSFLSIWNQYNIRRFILSNDIKYSKVINLFLKFMNLPKLPSKNKIINFSCISNLCIPIEYTDTFKYLLNYIISYTNKTNLFAVAIDENDILNYELSKFYYSKSQLDLLSNYNKNKFNFHFEISYG
jgi:hypothetical protein